MMKKTIFAILVSLMSPCAIVSAQDLTIYSDTLVAVSNEASFIPESEEDVMFAVRLPENNGLTDEVKELLNNKIVQILGRCNAGASGKQDVFVVEPVITLDGERKSEGLVRNVTSVNGELSLTARHRYSDAIFHNVVVPLSAAIKGSNANPMQMLVKAIRPADAAYVRFIKNARKNAFEFGLMHPEIYEIPELQDKKSEEPAASPAADAEPVDSVPVSPVAPVLSTAPVQQTVSLGEVYVSKPGLNVELLNCEYDASSRRIHFQLRVTNTVQGGDKGDKWTQIRQALDSDGTNYKSFEVDSFYHSFPYDVPVAVHGYIKDVFSNPMQVPFVEIQLGDTMVEIRKMLVKQP